MRRFILLTKEPKKIALKINEGKEKNSPEKIEIDRYSTNGA